MHEFLHAAGFYHEMARADRDDYITIHLENIQVGRKDSFALESHVDQGTPYDYLSVLHYGPNA